MASLTEILASREAVQPGALVTDRTRSALDQVLPRRPVCFVGIQPSMAYRVLFEELPWEACGPGVRHKVHRRGRQCLRLVEYSAAMPPHGCTRGHLGTILSGRFEIEFASGTEVFVEGDGVDIPAGDSHRHRARALTETVLALFVEEGL